MTPITSVRLEQVGSKMARGLDSDWPKTIASTVGKLGPVFHAEPVDSCISRFIDAELDYMTPGKRGIGRMTDFIPRLGAYYRKRLAALSDSKMAQLRVLLEDIVLSGYINAVGMWEAEIKEGYQSDSAELYKTWIPLIYVVGLSDYSESVRDIVIELSKPPRDEAARCMDALGMKEEFLRGKRSAILLYYATGGVLLRRCEILPEMRDLEEKRLRASL